MVLIIPHIAEQVNEKNANRTLELVRILRKILKEVTQMPGVKEKFSAALGWVIGKKKIKQKQLAAECGLSSSSIADYKTGRREGREDVRKKIAQALGLGYEDALFLGQWILDGKNPDDLWLNLKTLSTWQNAKNPISKSVGTGWGVDKPADGPTPPITGKGHIEQSILVGGTAEVGHPAFGESMSRWLAGKTENERYEIAKAGLVSLGTPSSAVVRVLAGAIEMPPGLLNSLPQELAQRFDAIWSYVCGADALHSSWQERYRTHYTAGQMTDSEVYIAAHEWLSTQKKMVSRHGR